MLHEFLVEHRGPILRRSRGKAPASGSPPPEVDGGPGVGRFYERLVELLKVGPIRDAAADPAMHRDACEHGAALFEVGCGSDRVVRAYGDLCQAITETAVDLRAPIGVEEFHTLNRCLDDAIAAAVGEHGRRKERALAEQGALSLAMLIHDIRNLVGTASLAFDLGQRGGEDDRARSTRVLGRSLASLKEMIETSLGDLALAPSPAPTSVAAVVEQVAASADPQAGLHGITLLTEAGAPEVEVFADRHRLSSAVTNLVHNAVKFTRPGGRVRLRARASLDRVLVEVEDECGGLAAGRIDDPSRSFEQRHADRSGLGLGLAISRAAAAACGGELRFVDRPGAGCTFTLDLPRSAPAAAGVEAATGKPV